MYLTYESYEWTGGHIWPYFASILCTSLRMRNNKGQPGCILRKFVLVFHSKWKIWLICMIRYNSEDERSLIWCSVKLSWRLRLNGKVRRGVHPYVSYRVCLVCEVLWGEGRIIVTRTKQREGGVLFLVSHFLRSVPAISGRPLSLSIATPVKFQQQLRPLIRLLEAK